MWREEREYRKQLHKQRLIPKMADTFDWNCETLCQSQDAYPFGGYSTHTKNVEAVKLVLLSRYRCQVTHCIGSDHGMWPLVLSSILRRRNLEVMSQSRGNASLRQKWQCFLFMLMEKQLLWPQQSVPSGVLGYDQ
jgi:hypothetical protein